MEKLNKYFKIIVISIIIILLVSGISMIKNAFFGRYYISINKSNENEIMQMLKNNQIKVDGTITRIGNMQGLGDWYLYIKCAGQEEESIILDDGDARDLYSYIKNNGTLGGIRGQIANNVFYFSIILLLICVCYKICYIIHKKNKRIMFFILLFDLGFIISKLIINYIGFEYLQWVNKFALIVTILGVIIGTIQIILKSENKKTKNILTIILILGGTIFLSIMPLMYIALFPPEHIVDKNNTKMVGYVQAFVRTNVEYYEYKNILIRGNKKIYGESYGRGGFDPFDGEHDDFKVEYDYYFDKNENIIRKNNQETIIPTDNNSEDNKILYEKVIDNNKTIRVINRDYILAQRSIIGIEKTTDGGKTWEEQLESADGFQIHNDSKFVFLDENIGFINDSGLAGTEGENRGLFATINGGKTFVKANIIHPNSIEEKNLFVNEVPYIEDGILKVQIYTINHSKNPSKTFYEFRSEDNGLTWKYERTEEDKKELKKEMNQIEQELREALPN